MGGRVDVLVNNAGYLRDTTFARMQEKDWTDILAIHMTAVFRLCKAVWPIMMQQEGGRIINVCSTSGLYGNFGQANYAAAKAGITGFSKTLALEGAKKGVRVNAFAPYGTTRMTTTIKGWSDEMSEMFLPKYVSPFVVWLAHKETDVTGRVFEVGGGMVEEVRWTKKGAFLMTRRTPRTHRRMCGQVDLRSRRSQSRRS